MTSPSDVARRAAVIVQARGLNKGGIGDVEGDGPVCMWGAIRVAGTNRFSADGHVLADALEVRHPDEATSFPGSWWNDDPATTVTDVAKLLLQVADDIDAGGTS